MTETKKAQPRKKKSAKEASKTWYDYPQYYDLGFRDVVHDEAKFLVEAFKKYVPGKTKKIFEPGCGTGRLVFEMASRGYQVTGLDLNANALAYCQKRLERKGLKAKLVQGDMTKFTLPTKFDAAFNTLNTFRHLVSEEQAVDHLNLVADHLKPGGIYVIGFHLLPPDAELYGSERWTAKQGETKINYSLSVMESSRRKRLEHLRITMNIHRPSGKLRLQDEFDLRLYSAAQVKSLFASVPKFELKDVFDFWYDISEPLPLNDDLEDAVFVLQKK